CVCVYCMSTREPVYTVWVCVCVCLWIMHTCSAYYYALMCVMYVLVCGLCACTFFVSYDVCYGVCYLVLWFVLWCVLCIRVHSVVSAIYSMFVFVCSCVG